MKNIFLIVIILSVSLFFSSCSSYITPALGGATSIGYISRPHVNDTVTSLTSIEGGFVYANSKGTTFNLGQFSVNKGYSFKSINFGFGIFGVAGGASYSNSFYDDNTSRVQNNSFKKNIFGYGFRTTIGLPAINKNGLLCFRLLNWENSYSVENGTYAQYRKDLYSGKELLDFDNNRTYISDLTNIYTTGFSTEILLNNKLDKDFQANVRFFYGFSPGYNESFKKINISNNNYNLLLGNISGVTLFLKYKRCYYLAEMLDDKNFTTRITLGYNIFKTVKK